LRLSEETKKDQANVVGQRLKSYRASPWASFTEGPRKQFPPDRNIFPQSFVNHKDEVFIFHANTKTLSFNGYSLEFIREARKECHNTIKTQFIQAVKFIFDKNEKGGCNNR